jgi:hypothetical protein
LNIILNSLRTHLFQKSCLENGIWDIGHCAYKTKMDYRYNMWIKVLLENRTFKSFLSAVLSKSNEEIFCR